MRQPFKLLIAQGIDDARSYDELPDARAPLLSLPAADEPPVASTPPANIPAGSETEIAYICGVTDDAKVAATAYGTWAGNSPATYNNTSVAYKWGSTALQVGGTAGGNVTYWFDGGSNWFITEANAFIAGLHLWSALANISFSAAASEAEADYRIIHSNNGAANTGCTLYPGTVGSATSGSPVAHTASTSIDDTSTSFGPIGDPSQSWSFNQNGGYAYKTIVHEEGHMLGLGHGGAYNAGDPPAFGSVQSRQFSAYDSRL